MQFPPFTLAINRSSNRPAMGGSDYEILQEDGFLFLLEDDDTFLLEDAA